MDIEKMTNGENPFDALMSEDGTWSARALLLDVAGYADWTRAKPAIERAVQAMDNIGISAGQHASRQVRRVAQDSPNTFGGKRTVEVEDYELTRTGAYFVFMNGDPRKPQIAAAQAYFNVMTQVAEQVKHKLPETFAEALELAASQARELESTRAEKMALEVENARIAPLAQAHEDWQTAQGAYPMDTAAHMLGTGRNRLYSTLREIGVLKKLRSEPIGTEIHNGHVPYQQYIDRGYFFTIASRHYVAETGITKVGHKVHITPKGLEWLKGKLDSL